MISEYRSPYVVKGAEGNTKDKALLYNIHNRQAKRFNATKLHRGEQVGGCLVLQKLSKGYAARCRCGAIITIYLSSSLYKGKYCKYCRPIDPYPLEGRRIILARYRCETSTSSDYPRWGGRGIKCLLTNSIELVAAIGKCPSKKHQLGRIDNNGHYEIGNVEWQDSKTNSNNTRASHLLAYKGRTQTISQWAAQLKLRHASTLFSRVKRGWSPEKVIETPICTRFRRKHK